ncbi:MAG: UDP-N-acetylmuramate--L-alanine ligase [Candidatus Eremiobacteraeota bacterium]|nr:UDP-N-acetylmuramate--L-alanine ligase [Candidatus Eremiobacteraeota bacterium]
MTEGTLHFIGIGGIGMSAIARIFLARGEAVSGSDIKETPLVRNLREAGATIHLGHAGKHVRGARAVVVSSAIDPKNPEFVAAKEAGLPIFGRGEMLAKLMEGRRGIAIAGTHGKTTTTAIASSILRYAGVDATILVGGESHDTGTNAHDGASEWFLTEADESDGSFMELRPVIALVTNIENDHIASDADLPKLRENFSAFLERLPEDGVAIVGIDNKHSALIAPGQRPAKTVTFGLTSAADVHAANVRFADLGSTFDVIAGGVCLGSARLRVPGEINIANALGAIVVARELGVPFVQVAEALADFHGVRRRFDILARSERMTIVDDYAHHPTAVQATIAAARRYYAGPIVVAFQPHRYTRTAYLARDFAESLRGVELVFLTPVYAASELPIEGVSERSIGEPLRATGANVQYVPSVEALPEAILEHAPPGALVLMLGAGNITNVAAQLAARLSRAQAVS